MKNEFENEFGFDDEVLKQQILFETEYFKMTEWSLNKKQFQVYVACCKAMEKIAKSMGGEVEHDYKTILSGKDKNFNDGIRFASCSIVVPYYFSLSGNAYSIFKQVLDCSTSIEILSRVDEKVDITITIPDVFIDKGISI